MNQLSLIQALTGVIPGQGANTNSSQGAPAGSGAGLFGSLLGQQLSGAAQALQNIQPGQTLAAGPGQTPAAGLPDPGVPIPGLLVPGLPADGSPDGASALLQVTADAVADQSSDGSPDGASALLQVTAAAAADQSLPASPVFNATGASDPDSNGAIEGQVLFGLVDRAADNAANAAAENSPVLAAVLADDGGTIFTAGPNDQNIPAPFQEISPSAETGETDDTDIIANIVIGQLPAAASATAALASGKERASAAAPLSGEESDSAIAIALAIVPESNSVAAAAEGLGPAAAPSTPPLATVRGEAAPLDALKTVRGGGDNQSRPQVAPQGSESTQTNFQGNAGGSGDLDGGDQQSNQQSGAQTGTAGKKGLGAGAGRAVSNSVAELPASVQPSGQLQSHMTPLRALESSMALNAGLILPFDGGAAVDPMTGMQTSLSAQSLAAGIQALQAGASVSAPAQSAPGFAHTANFVTHQVGLQITRAIADGQNEFTIRLNPPELGRVEVRLEFLADGGVRAALSAEKPETLNLLQRDAAALERALNDAGVKTDAGSLNFSLQQGETQAGQDDATGAGSMAAAGDGNDQDSPPDAEIEITEQIIQQMVADGTVDIRV